MKKYFSLIIMIILSIGMQLLGMIKASIIASTFGASAELDAYNLINSFVGLVFGFIPFGITTIFIPKYVNKEERKKLYSFCFIVYLLALVLLIFVINISDYFYMYFYDNAFAEVLVSISSIICLTYFFQTFTGIVNGISQCEKNFNNIKVINLIFNFVTIVVLMNINLSIRLYSKIILIITIINISVQIFYLRRYLKSLFNVAINKYKDFTLLKSFLPIAVGSSIYQLTLSVDMFLASSVGEGAISQLAYSTTLNGMIVGLIFNNLMIFIYPKISELILDNKKKCSDEIFKYSKMLAIIMSIISVIILLNGEVFIKLLYERGAFTSEMTSVVSDCLIVYTLILPVSAVKDLMYKYFYIKDDTKTPFLNSVYTSMLNIIFSIILVGKLGLLGIVWGTFISTLISYFMISKKMYVKYNINFLDLRIIKTFKNILVSGIGTYIIFDIFKYLCGSNSLFVEVFIYTIIIIIIYFCCINIIDKNIKGVFILND